MMITILANKTKHLPLSYANMVASSNKDVNYNNTNTFYSKSPSKSFSQECKYDSPSKLLSRDYKYDAANYANTNAYIESKVNSQSSMSGPYFWCNNDPDYHTIVDEGFSKTEFTICKAENDTEYRYPGYNNYLGGWIDVSDKQDGTKLRMSKRIRFYHCIDIETGIWTHFEIAPTPSDEDISQAREVDYEYLKNYLFENARDKVRRNEAKQAKKAERAKQASFVKNKW